MTTPEIKAMVHDYHVHQVLTAYIGPSSLQLSI